MLEAFRQFEGKYLYVNCFHSLAVDHYSLTCQLQYVCFAHLGCSALQQAGLPHCTEDLCEELRRTAELKNTRIHR